MRRDLVTSQPAAGALFTIVRGELFYSGVATVRQKIERHAEGGGDGGLTLATTRGLRAPCGGRGLPPGQRQSRDRPSARRARGGDRGGEAGTWLAGACPEPCVSREALLGVPRQHVAPGRVAEGASQGPCGGSAATEGERVVEGAAAERQVRGAVDPAHPHGAWGVGSLPACAGRRRTRRTPRNAVG